MLGSTKFKGIRKLANAQKPTFRADISGIVDDIGTAVFGSGSSLPTATADKWAGRSFFHTTEGTWYVCDGTNWLSVGGQQSVPLNLFGAQASGYVIDSAGGGAYVYRNGRRIDVRLRMRKSSGVLAHAENVFTVSSAYRPAGVGAWPLAANQSGGAASAIVCAAVLNAAGQIYPLSPDGTSEVLELNGSYYIP